MIILGISAFYHDSAAALVVNGEIVAAVQEERFTRIKHDSNFPVNAVSYCLEYAGISYKDIDFVTFYDKPLLTFDRLLETWLVFAPFGFGSFIKALPIWLHQKLRTTKEIDKGLQDKYTGPILYTQHHQSHAASAFFPSPYKESAILTVDGVGEWATTTISYGVGNNIKMLKEMHFPHSLGLLYSAFTYYTGFRVNSGEYKLMGLAPYGNSIFVDLILDNLMDLKEDGSFRLDMRYFDYCAGLKMTSIKFHKLFGAEPRSAESKITQREMDIAASIQKVTEIVMIKLAKTAKEITGSKNICLAGGVALNCVANGKILEEKIFDNIFIQPASGDAGGALGAALFTHYQINAAKRESLENNSDYQKGSYLGPEYSNSDIKEVLDGIGASYCYIKDSELSPKVAEEISKERVVGLFLGRSEFGPRALGARSIVGDARSKKMQSVLNLKIKFRESFRPFAPIVLEEKANEYFNLETPSPYMLLVAPVKESKHINSASKDDELFGVDKLNQIRSEIPAVTHVDYSARVQTVSKERNGIIYDIVKEFDELTGCPVIINTSFNIRGEPIVLRPEEAYKCFMYTDMDTLVLGSYILKKEEQPELPGAKEYKSKFKLD